MRILAALALAPLALQAAPPGPLVALEDPQGQVCVIFDTRDTHPVSCTDPGARGFRVTGIPPAPDPSRTLEIASAGDVNRDGSDDVAISAPWADYAGRARAGVTWVVFGSGSTAPVDVADLGGRGFTIGGATAGDAAMTTGPDRDSGRGDIDGDGLDDIVLVSAGQRRNGAAWVVFGKRDGAAVDLASLGAGGFRIDGGAGAHAVGNVAIAGDFDGDGKDDLALEDPNGIVVLGKASSAPVDLAAPRSRAVTIRGPGCEPWGGTTLIGVGDLDGDGRDDLLAGRCERTNDHAYVILGRRRMGAIDVLHLGARGYALRQPADALDFGTVLSAPGRLRTGAHPQVGISDDVDTFVLPAGETRLAKARRITYSQDPGNGTTVPMIARGIGAPDSARGRGDLLVLQYVYATGTYRSFVVFGAPGPGTTDLRHLGRAGFEITG